MNVWRTLAIALLCLSVSFPAAALDYYRAKVPVKSQSETDRARSTALGLKDVLVRLSGSTEVVQSPQIRSALQKPLAYLEQFQYEQARDEMGTMREYLVMTFNPSVIENLLRDAQQPFWPVNRPEVLVWLVENSRDGGKTFVNDGAAPVVRSIASAAKARGVPVRFPLLDLEDQMSLTPEQLWSFDEEALLRAAERYKSDTLLVGRYAETSVGEWLVTWQYFHRGEWRNYETRDSDVQAIGYGAINPLADYLAGLYAVAPGSQEEGFTTTQVRGVDSFMDYRKMLDYLDGLAVVNGFQLVSIADDVILMNVQITGDLDQFQNVLSLDRKMRFEAGQADARGPGLNILQRRNDQPLDLRWIGGSG